MNTGYLIAFFCVAGLTAGQLLFKLSANTFADAGFTPRAIAYMAIALMIYMIQTIAWIWALKTISLGRVYPVMALAFVLIPLGSMYFFNEKFTLSYWAGIALIFTGIIVITRSLQS